MRNALKTIVLFPILFFFVLIPVEAKTQQYPDCRTLTTINFDISPSPVGLNEEMVISGNVSYGRFACSIGSRIISPLRSPTFFQVSFYSDKGEFENLRCNLNDTCNGNNFTGRYAVKKIPSQLGYTNEEKINIYVRVYVTDENGTAKINESFRSADFKNLTYGCLTRPPVERYVCSSDKNSSQFAGCSEDPRPVDRSLCGHGPSIAAACVVAGRYYCFAPNKEPDGRICDEGYGLRNDLTSDLCNTYANPADVVAEEVNGQTIGKFIPKCVNLTHGEAFLKSECGDVTIFLKLMIKIIHYLFGIIGGIALLFFVYGGFVFILSQGNADKVQHGKSIILAAVLGIIVAFSGYALVRFVGDVVGIKNDYKLQQ